MSEKAVAFDMFGENVFNLKTMRNYVSEAAYEAVLHTTCSGGALDASYAGEIADAMKTWALENDVTHYTHWFQPLTGLTAEKHDSFLQPDGKGGAIASFSGKELIQGEPDASSFPSGGLRATFEARGYTGWDCTSPAFIKYDNSGAATLCIPTVFCGYHGEALDKKTPLLRSMAALSKQMCRLAEHFGVDCEGKRAYAVLGCEQEYFLIDEEYYMMRPDLVQCGRTLFGLPPAKHQQQDDHYFGSIRSRVIAFMAELDSELWRLGVPAKTRHNEVAPAQFEIAPVYEELNLAIDHNMVCMEVMHQVAERHGFVCLQHEKPFAGVNGSGKHNNWSVVGPDGVNWLKPGKTPEENAKYLTMICALVKAVDTHADLLRAGVASAANDHRLGANEAPPAVISVFLGTGLEKTVLALEHGTEASTDEETLIHLGVDTLPDLPRGNTDRNRTSPFALTGPKFEFRAVGSSQNPSGANVILNTIVAESFDYIATELDKANADGKEFNSALQAILATIVADHKKVLFSGDGYTDEWQEEAARRGLPNLRNTPEALKAMASERAVKLFSKYSVLSERELNSRNEVYGEGYETQIEIEATCSATIIRTMIIPAAQEAAGEMADTLACLEDQGLSCTEQRLVLEQVAGCIEKLLAATRVLEAAETAADQITAMDAARAQVDTLEGLVPAEVWPLPSYTDMLLLS